MKKSKLTHIEDIQLYNRIQQNKADLKPCPAFEESIQKFRKRKDSSRTMPINNKHDPRKLEEKTLDSF